MLRPLFVSAIALLVFTQTSIAASPAPSPIKVSVQDHCADPEQPVLKDMVEDPSADLIVEMTLFDRESRVIDQLPLVTKDGRVAEAHHPRQENITVEANGGVMTVPVCVGHAAAVRVRPAGEGATIDLFLEVASLKPGVATKRLNREAAAPDVVHIEKSVSMRNGETVALKVGGNGPVGRITLSFGRVM